jgi:hypothetical protein
MLQSNLILKKIYVPLRIRFFNPKHPYDVRSYLPTGYSLVETIPVVLSYQNVFVPWFNIYITTVEDNFGRRYVKVTYPCRILDAFISLFAK